MARKRRTRQHVIADLSINHVERQALLAECAVDCAHSDYGVDLYVYSYDGNGEIENGHILIQVKSTDHLQVLAGGTTVSLRVTQGDFDRWLGEILPVLLVIYDAAKDVAHWVVIQPYLTRGGSATAGRQSVTLTIHLPLSNRLDPETFRWLAEQKNRLFGRGVS